MPKMKRIVFFACLFSYSLLNAQSIQRPVSMNEKIDSIMSFFNDPSFPATVLEVIRNGKVIYCKGFGKEDQEKNIPPTSKSNFNIASNSKQFAAMCILLLQEEGKLKRTDDIRKYIPEMPVYDKPITINDLIHHTSGLRDYLELYQLTCKPVFELSQKERLKLITDQKHLNFLPGQYHLYSNTNYLLLGIIVERVSGMPLHKYMRENIFLPLGMKQTYFSDERSVTHEVINYVKNGNTFSPTNNTYPFVTGEGGILSNADDLLMWDQNFYHNILGKKTNELLTEIQETGILNNQENTFYAGALFNIQYKGRQAVFHGGGFNNFSTQLLRFPSDSLSIIFLSDLNHDCDSYCFKIADLFFQNNLKSYSSVSSNLLTNQNLSGYYFNETLPGCRYLAQKDNVLTLKGVTYSQIDTNQYSARDSWDWERRLKFSTSAGGELRMNYQMAFTNDTYRKLKEDTLRKSYAGIYYCPELSGLQFELKFSENKPVFVISKKYTAEVTETFGTTGIVPTLQAIVEFQVNAEDKVTGFMLSTDRVKNLFFQKVHLKD
jgi:CubicO group peptidase (beta-lactamase class C family)